MGTFDHRPATTAVAIHVLITLVLLSAASADPLLVRTVDPLTGEPIAGAYVQVGPSPGIPFAANSGFTGAGGTILFDDPALSGPQTVTAGTAERAYLTITAAPQVEVTLRLPRRAAADTLPEPVARVTGRGLGIATVANDGRFDIGFVLPALDLGALLGGGGVPFEAPPDTASFPPPIGPTPLPGIVTMPPQLEFLFLNFEKPTYKIDLADNTIQSLFCLSGRIAITDLFLLGGNSIFGILNAFEMREVGIERDRAVMNGALIDIDVDLNLSRALNVSFAGVPAGNTITAVSAARIAGPGGSELYVLYDGKNALSDQASSLTLASQNPSGDLADAVNAAVATWGDSSAAGPDFLSAIVKRDGFLVPASLIMDSFFLIPDVAQDEWTFTFTDATNPGVSPSPTWSESTIILESGSGEEASTSTHWLVFAPAALRGFTLPSLAPEAPPTLPDPRATPEEDRLRLVLTVNNQSGDAQAVLDDPLGDATHLANRTIDIEFPTTAGDRQPSTPRVTRARLGPAYPDPFTPSVVLPVTAAMDGPLTLAIHSADGRRVRKLTETLRSGALTRFTWDGRDDLGRLLPSGTYIVRIEGVPGEQEKVVFLK